MARPFRGQLHVRIPPRLHEEVARESFEKNISQSGICAQALVVRNALRDIDPWKEIERTWAESPTVNLSQLEEDISEALTEVRGKRKKRVG